MLSFTIGADPEWFVKNDKKIVSVIGKVGGTKSDPKPVLGGGGFSVQEDNVAIEYNIPECHSVDQWCDHHHVIQTHITKEILKPLGLKKAVVASHVFDEDQLKDPRSWVFGCEPDFNAWSLEVNPRPKSEQPRLRSAGGHIHVGCFSMTKMEKIELCRVLDAYISLPLMAVDLDVSRRLLYGRAGAMRFKKYGLEYRTPSNYWTRNQKLIRWAATSVGFACKAFNKGLRINDPDVQEAINTNDLVGAKTLMLKYGVDPL